MKLLLTSEGLYNKSITESFLELAEKPAEELSIAYITTAFNASSSQNKKWVREALQRFEKLKIGQLDFLDFASLPKEKWLPRLERCDVVYVEGGDVLFLLEKIDEAELAVELKRLLGTKVYVGASAGSMILGEKVLTTKSTDPKVGLGVVKFSLRPHYAREDRSFFDDKKIQELAGIHESVFYGLDDNTALKVVDGEVEVISEGKWKKFEVEG